jgi:superfamily II DNA or RNA helicase
MLLGDRTVALIERLAAARIGCLILDECHHLLDWWALVVSGLVERLRLDREVALIGLTATLPDPESNREAENYRGLLGRHRRRTAPRGDGGRGRGGSLARRRALRSSD